MLKDIDLKYAQGTLKTTKNLAVGGTLAVTGAATLAAGLAVTGATSSTGALSTTGGLLSNGVELATPQPQDLGLKTWSFDPGLTPLSGQATVSGTIYLAAQYVRSTTSVSNIWFTVQNTQAVTAGANWVGLYSSAGTKLIDAATDSVVNTTGIKTVPISTQSLTPGFYWVAILIGFSGTAVQIGAAVTNATFRPLVNGNLAAASYRWAVNGTAAGTLPSTITPANNTTTNFLAPWVALS